jgi:hypothetical protein
MAKRGEVKNERGPRAVDMKETIPHRISTGFSTSTHYNLQIKKNHTI